MDAFFWEGGLINKLKCSNCSGYMAAHIYQCGNGHNICDTCKKNIAECPECKRSFVARNQTLENISEATRFPCINVMFGCSEMMVVSKLRQHASVCPYRMYNCRVSRRIDCKWRGGKNVLVEHVQEKHKEVAHIDGEQFSVVVHNFELPKEVWDCQLLQAHGEVFLFHQRYSAVDRKVYSAVQFIGQPEIAKQFVYKIIYTSVISPEKVSMTCHSHMESEDFQTILLSKDCAYVEFRKLEHLVHNSMIKFEIKVKKAKK